MIIGDLKNVYSLEGKTALITGGGQGFGGAIAEGFAQFGADVSVVDINQETADAVAAAAEKMGRKAIALKCDVSDAEQVLETVEKSIQALGKIDILAAVAGIGDRAMAEDMSMQQWKRVIDINLTGVWMFDQAVGKHLISRKAPGSKIGRAHV